MGARSSGIPIRQNSTIFLLTVSIGGTTAPIRSFANLDLALENLERRGMDKSVGTAVRKKTGGFWSGTLRNDIGEPTTYILQPLRHTTK